MNSMNNKCSLAVALVAGILGGMLTRYITPPSAFAQNDAKIADKSNYLKKVIKVLNIKKFL